MKALSSSSTVVSMYILPGIHIAILPVWLVGIFRHPLGWLPALLWICLGAVFILVGRRIKKVDWEGETFAVSNYFKTVHVPTAHLRSVTESYVGRSPSLVLHFNPPTAFGPRVDIILPTVWWGEGSSLEVIRLLDGIVARNRGPEAAAGPSGPSPRVRAIAGDPRSGQETAVVALEDSELDDLIERLPGDSALRDFARGERQRRWYG